MRTAQPAESGILRKPELGCNHSRGGLGAGLGKEPSAFEVLYFDRRTLAHLAFWASEIFALASALMVRFFLRAGEDPLVLGVDGLAWLPVGG